jgi:2-dehydro-3-deoxygluconokinase
MRSLTASADLLIANEEDIPKALGLGPDAGSGSPGLDPAAYERLTAEVMAAFPNLSRAAVTLRESRSADRNGWSAVLRNRGGFLAGPTYEIADIVDRIGAGDAFAAGLIHGLLNGGTDREALDFAVAASCLKHSIPGDFNRVGEAEVLALVRGEAGGRIRR